MCLRYLIWIGILLSEGLYSTGKFCESRTLYCANAAVQWQKKAFAKLYLPMD